MHDSCYCYCVSERSHSLGSLSIHLLVDMSVCSVNRKSYTQASLMRGGSLVTQVRILGLASEFESEIIK